MAPPADHPNIPAPGIGVLLANLGSPAAPTSAAVRRYLKEFLSDRRVIEIPPLVWQPILRGMVLNARPARSARLYARIWDRKRGGSPLVLHTADQAAALKERMPDVRVEWAMRYGAPAIGERLKAMHEAGCTRILVAPLYPQYSAATTASAVDAVGAALARMRWQPAIRTLPPYADEAVYVGAVAESVQAALAALDFTPDMLFASFHGMPRRAVERGDPYHRHCQQTGRLLGERLNVPVETVFQSRFGRAEWLQPYFADALRAAPGRGLRRIAVVAPGFAADCLETLEEIAIRGRDTFLAAGGEAFHYIACLNASARGVDMLEWLLRRELRGWTESISER